MLGTLVFVLAIVAVALVVLAQGGVWGIGLLGLAVLTLASNVASA